MSLETVVKTIEQIDQVEELTVLLDARESARRIFAALQDMHAATGNPLYADYMEIVARAGKTLNDDIKAWAEKQAALHASARYDSLREEEANR